MRTIPAVLLAGLALVACGGSATSSASTSATISTAPATPSATTRTATAVRTSTITKPPAPPACRAGGLALSFLGQQGATGHGELGFALRNVGASSCRTYGYPGILFLARGGAPLPTAPAHATHDFFGVAPAVALVLSRGASASFRLGVTHGSASSAGCTTAYGLQVIPPDDTATLRTNIPQGAYECRGATVSPLRPGHSAYP